MKAAQRVVYENLFKDDDYLEPTFASLTARLDLHADARAVLEADAKLTPEGVQAALDGAGTEIGTLLDGDIAAVEKRLANLRSSEALKREPLPEIPDLDRAELLKQFKDLDTAACLDLLINPDAHQALGLALLHTPQEITDATDELLAVYRELHQPYTDPDNAARVTGQIAAHESLLNVLKTERGSFPHEDQADD